MTNKNMTEKYNTEIKPNQPAKRSKATETLGSFDDQSILEKSLYEIKIEFSTFLAHQSSSRRIF